MAKYKDPIAGIKFIKHKDFIEIGGEELFFTLIIDLALARLKGAVNGYDLLDERGNKVEHQALIDRFSALKDEKDGART